MEPVDVGTKEYSIRLIQRYSLGLEGDGILLDGHKITAEFLFENGFSHPIVVPTTTGLDLKLPGENFTVQHVKQLLGPQHMVTACDVELQEYTTLTMAQFCKSYYQKNPGKIYNLISLELSNTKLKDLFGTPLVVRDLNWYVTAWPPDFEPDKKPEMSKYCLISPKYAYTDVGGTSAWLHAFQGEKIFYLVEPTPENLMLFAKWNKSQNRRKCFFGDMVECHRVTLTKGQTLFLPAGWIHAVLTTIPSLVFAGNFYHFIQLDAQIRANEIVSRIDVLGSESMPCFEEIHWFGALQLIQHVQPNRKLVPNHIIKGANALLCACIRWHSHSPEKFIHETVDKEQILKSLVDMILSSYDLRRAAELAKRSSHLQKEVSAEMLETDESFKRKLRTPWEPIPGWFHHPSPTVGNKNLSSFSNTLRFVSKTNSERFGFSLVRFEDRLCSKKDVETILEASLCESILVHVQDIDRPFSEMTKLCQTAVMMRLRDILIYTLQNGADSKQCECPEPTFDELMKEVIIDSSPRLLTNSVVLRIVKKPGWSMGPPTFSSETNVHPTPLSEHLNSDLQRHLQANRIADLPGISSSVLCIGQRGTFLPMQYKDFVFGSVSYLTCGASIVRVIISPQDTFNFINKMENISKTSSFPITSAETFCQYLTRNDQYVISTNELDEWNIRYVQILQQPGDLFITIPFALHFGICLGGTIAETTNYFDKNSWPPFVTFFHHNNCLLPFHDLNQQQVWESFKVLLLDDVRTKEASIERLLEVLQSSAFSLKPQDYYPLEVVNIRNGLCQHQFCLCKKNPNSTSCASLTILSSLTWKDYDTGLALSDYNLALAWWRRRAETIFPSTSHRQKDTATIGQYIHSQLFDKKTKRQSSKSESIKKIIFKYLTLVYGSSEDLIHKPYYSGPPDNFEEEHTRNVKLRARKKPRTT